MPERAESAVQTISRADLEKVEHFLADIPDACRHLIRVTHRDRKGAVVPMELMPAQMKAHRTVESVRALELAKQTRPGTDAFELISAFRDLPEDFRARMDHILDANPTLFLREARQIGVVLKDGPVKIVHGKCRRGGISAYWAARNVIEANFTPAFRASITAHKGDNATVIFSYYRDFHKRWPTEYLHLRPETKSESGWRYTWEHDASIRVQTAGGRDSGRGDQQDVYHFSEAAFYPDFQEVYDTLAAAPRHAWVALETTANGPTGGYYDVWTEAMELEDVVHAYASQDAVTLDAWNGYVRYFFSWLEEPEYRVELEDYQLQHMLDTLTDHERSLMADWGAKPAQIAWRRQKLRDFGKNVDPDGLKPDQRFLQEYPHCPEVMFQSTGSKLFDTGKLEAMSAKNANRKPAGAFQLYDQGLPIAVRPYQANFTVWEPPRPGANYVIGADVSKGLKKRDWSVAVVLHRLDETYAREVAMYRHRPGAKAFGDILACIGEMYNNAFLVPEVNDAGYATCIRLVEDLRYSNLYHRRVIDLVKNSTDDTNAFRFGWHANKGTKAAAAQGLVKAIDDGHVEFSSQVIINELKAYENDNGQYGAPQGQHDDCVVAAFLAWLGHSRAAPPIDPRELKRIEQQSRLDRQDRTFWDQIEQLKRDAEKRAKRKGLARR